MKNNYTDFIPQFSLSESQQIIFALEKNCRPVFFWVKAIASSAISEIMTTILYVVIYVTAYFRTVQNLNYFFTLSVYSLLLGCIINLGDGGVYN